MSKGDTPRPCNGERYRENYDRIFSRQSQKVTPKVTFSGRNALRCKHCGDEIESFHRHDFVMCSCGKIGVDGGREYYRWIGNSSDWETLE